MLQEFAHTVASRPSRLALLLVACACLAPAAAPAQDWVYGGPPVIVMPPPAVVVPAPHYDPCRDGSINWGRPVNCEELMRRGQGRSSTAPSRHMIRAGTAASIGDGRWIARRCFAAAARCRP